MARYVWLVLTLVGWALVAAYVPRMPPVVFLGLAGVSAAGYLYGWAVRRRNWLSYFFASGIWLGAWAAYEVMAGWEEGGWGQWLAPWVLGKVVMAASLPVAGFLTFANYRISLNYIQRRGNIDRDLLGRLHRDTGPWEAIKRLFRRRRKGEVVIDLGEEIPFE